MVMKLSSRHTAEYGVPQDLRKVDPPEAAAFVAPEAIHERERVRRRRRSMKLSNKQAAEEFKCERCGKQIPADSPEEIYDVAIGPTTVAEVLSEENEFNPVWEFIVCGGCFNEIHPKSQFRAP
jgi:hypothetical protein